MALPSLFATAGTRRPRQRLYRSCTCLALCASWLHSACSLDERVLALRDVNGGADNQGGQAALPAAGVAGSLLVEAGAHADGGEAGRAEDPAGGAPSFGDGCADLDRSGTSDCAEGLLENSGFAADVSGWTAEIGATIEWDPLDLLGAASSGSAVVRSSGSIDAVGNSLVAADQCLAVDPGKILEIYANVQIDTSAVAGNAAISLWFFPTPECGESTSSLYQTDPIEGGKTVTLHGATAVPDSMISVRVRLGVIKPFKAESFSARFDNVLVVAR